MSKEMLIEQKETDRLEEERYLRSLMNFGRCRNKIRNKLTHLTPKKKKRK